MKLPVKQKKTIEVSGEVYVLETMSHTHSGVQLFWNNQHYWRAQRELASQRSLSDTQKDMARRFCAAIHLNCLEVNHYKDDFLWRLFGHDELIDAMKSNLTIKEYLSEADKRSQRTNLTRKILRRTSRKG